MEELVGLAGLQEGPKGAFPDGARYEYDSDSKQPLKSRFLADRFGWVCSQVNFSGAQESWRHTKPVVRNRTLNELRPLLVVIAGPMGAGKTTFYDAHLKEAFPHLVPPVPHQREAMLREHRSFAVEDLVVDPELLRERQGCRLRHEIIFISTEDANLNIGRILIRMSRGGQSVPLNTIPESYDESMRSLPKARKQADDVLVYDNPPDGKDTACGASLHNTCSLSRLRLGRFADFSRNT